MKKILFITSSEGKIKEARNILGEKYPLEQVDLNLDEIQAIAGRNVVEHKVKEGFKLLKKPVIVEDTSLYFEAWKGLLGALVKWFLKTVGCEGICRMLRGEKNRKVIAESAYAFYDGKELKMGTGKIKGNIPIRPQGKHGFGWDPIFIPEGLKKTFAQMTMKEKNKISMRKLALEKLRRYLVKYA